MNHAHSAAAIIALATAAANAGPTFLLSAGETLYRVNGSTVDTFNLGERITSAATAPDGTVFLSASRTDDPGGLFPLFTLNDPAGTPSLNLIGNFLEESTPSLSFINGTLYGAQQFDFPNTQKLITIDPNAQTQTTVGATGEIGVQQPATAFDPASQRLFGVNNGATSELFEIDWDLSDGPDPTATTIGATGQDTLGTGAEWRNGKMFHALFADDGNGTYDLLLGTIDTATGNFTTLRTLATGQDATAVGLAIIPTPGAATLFAVAGLAASRRRR